MIHHVDGLDVGMEWTKADPTDWRNQPDPDGDNDDALDDDDESLPTPQYVKSMLGFDPDEDSWQPVKGATNG